MCKNFTIFVTLCEEFQMCKKSHNRIILLALVRQDRDVDIAIFGNLEAISRLRNPATSVASSG